MNINYINKCMSKSIISKQLNKYYYIICDDEYFLDLYLVKKYMRHLDMSKSDIKIIGNSLLNRSAIETFIAPFVTEVGNEFLTRCDSLVRIELQSLKKVGNNFLYSLEDKRKILHLDLPVLEDIGNSFLYRKNLKQLTLPNLRKTGDYFLSHSSIETLNLPIVETIGHNFLSHTQNIREISLNSVKEIGNYFMANSYIRKIELQNVKIIGDQFMYLTQNIDEIILPNVESVGSYFMYSSHIKKVTTTKLINKGQCFLSECYFLVKYEFQS